MSPVHDSLYVHGSEAEKVLPAVEPPFNPAALTRLEGRPVSRFPQQLRLHRALDELGWTGVIEEVNETVRPRNQSLPEPILITADGTILAGLGRWRAAMFGGRQEIHCIEYALSEEQSLHFILTYHQPQRGWNAYIRICLALTLEPYMQQRALANMRAGGKWKGWANLPKADQVAVREEIARAAGVGARNVSKVKDILKFAHPRLKQALADGTLSIHRAAQLCELTQAQQVGKFTQAALDRATNKLIRQAIGSTAKNEAIPDTALALSALQEQERLRPGSVEIRMTRSPRTIIFVSRDLQAVQSLQVEVKVS